MIVLFQFASFAKNAIIRLFFQTKKTIIISRKITRIENTVLECRNEFYRSLKEISNYIIKFIKDIHKDW